MTCSEVNLAIGKGSLVAEIRVAPLASHPLQGVISGFYVDD